MNQKLSLMSEPEAPPPIGTSSETVPRGAPGRNEMRVWHR